MCTCANESLNWKRWENVILVYHVTKVPQASGVEQYKFIVLQWSQVQTESL
jgi:hypothetical protein